MPSCAADLAVTVLVITSYILGAFVTTVIYGWLVGRPAWFVGRLMTGLIATDGSTAQSSLDRWLVAIGLRSAAPDLYNFSEASEKCAPPLMEPALVRMGFRGRSEDPRSRRICWQTFTTMGETPTGDKPTGEGKSADDLCVERAARVIQRRARANGLLGLASDVARVCYLRRVQPHILLAMLTRTLLRRRVMIPEFTGATCSSRLVHFDGLSEAGTTHRDRSRVTHLPCCHAC